jgi:site-specific recombinase XerD
MARPKELPKRLTPSEATALLRVPNRRAPSGVRNRALLTLFYRAGLRCAEALALTPRDVQLASGEIIVRLGKGGKDRVIPGLDGETIEILDRWKSIRPRSDFFVCATRKGNEGNPLDPGYVRKMVARYGERAGIEVRVYPHMLRHSFASELLEEGASIAAVQKLLGHARIGTTELYLHLVDGALRETMQNRPGGWS